MVLRSMFLGAVLAALISTPASAQPELEPLKPCYVAAREDQREFIEIRAYKFTPLATVDVYLDETLQPNSPRALFDGSLSGRLQAPFVDSGQREFTLRLTEPETSTNTVSAVSRVTRFSVEQVPKSAKTHEPVRFRGRGFTLPQPVYAHYVFGGKSLRTIRLGIPTGECGTFSVRRKQFPFKKRPKVGTWTIQFDQLSYYDPNARAKVPMSITVRKAIKPRSARGR